MEAIRKYIKNYNIIFILTAMSCSLWLAGYSYAQEQNIAESFGLYSKGIDYYHKGKLYEAKDILEQAVKIDPRNDDAQGYLDLVNAEINMRKQGHEFF
jgi:tetratricopeptide (TPR) repeat protein